MKEMKTALTRLSVLVRIKNTFATAKYSFATVLINECFAIKNECNLTRFRHMYYKKKNYEEVFELFPISKVAIIYFHKVRRHTISKKRTMYTSKKLFPNWAMLLFCSFLFFFVSLVPFNDFAGKILTVVISGKKLEVESTLVYLIFIGYIVVFLRVTLWNLILHSLRLFLDIICDK